MGPLKVTLDRNCIIALERYSKGRTRARDGKKQSEGQKREETNAIAVLRLNEFQMAKVITLLIPDASMLENQPEDGEEDFSSYREHLKRIGLEVEASSIFKAADQLALRQGDILDYRHSFDHEELLRRRIQNTLFPCDAYDFADHLGCYCKRTGNDPQLLADVLESRDVSNLEVLFPYEPQRLERLIQALNEKGESLKRAAKDCEDKWMNRFCDVATLYAHATWGGDIFVTDDQNFIEKQHRLRHQSVQVTIMTPPDTVEFIEKIYLPHVMAEKDPG
jgi:hypothetical protein